ncbi:MAG: hypothetical protein ACI8TX_003094 [Hyphomicrobiaceae bacterium]|jgi:hypothetical protein
MRRGWHGWVDGVGGLERIEAESAMRGGCQQPSPLRPSRHVNAPEKIVFASLIALSMFAGPVLAANPDPLSVASQKPDAGGVEAAGDAPVVDSPSPPITPAAAARNARMKELATSLREIADTHGPDAVVLQTKLLMKSLAAGAVGATEVQAPRPDPEAPESFLLIQTLTGVYFDSSITTVSERRATIWDLITGPLMVEMGSFNLAPKGLALAFEYRVQDGRQIAGAQVDPSEPSQAEQVRFEFKADLLQSYVDGEIDAVQLRETSLVIAAPRAPKSS